MVEVHEYELPKAGGGARLLPTKAVAFSSHGYKPDQLVALDSESHPATLSALLDDDSKSLATTGKTSLSGKMAEDASSAKTKEAWDDQLTGCSVVMERTLGLRQY